jgi:hypothetical protein
MRKIFFSLLLIFICGFNLFAQSSVIKEEEYAVYARVLRHIRSEDLEQTKAKYSFVILDTTFSPNYFSEYKNGKFRNLSKDFVRKNLTSSKLETLFPVKYEYQITSQAEIDELLKIGRNELERVKAEYKLRNVGITDESGFVWQPFYAKYPKANGYYQFSRVGFSSDKKFALVMVEGKGAYWSSNMEYILRKTKGKWTVYQAGGGFSVE